MKKILYSKPNCAVLTIKHPSTLCESNSYNINAGEMANGINDDNNDFFND